LFDNKLKQNKFATREEMIDNLCIINCGDDKVVKGYSYSSFGATYNYQPLKDVIISLFLLHSSNKIYGPSRHMTFVFTLFVMMQIGNFFSSRFV